MEYPALWSPLLRPDRLYSRAEVLARPSPVPAVNGVYAWYFKQLPAAIEEDHCQVFGNRYLLYVGIAPNAASVHGTRTSRANLRQRLRDHMRGNAFGSTLRLSLGCLLADELGLSLRRVGSGTRLTFADGEKLLSDWLDENASVCWLDTPVPWLVEEHVISLVPLPLNLDQNVTHPFYSTLHRLRAEARQRARYLPILTV